MSDSILTSTKKVLGLDESYTAFDQDVIMHVNTIFGVLHQLGVGPTDGFMIEDDVQTWEDFTGIIETVPGHLAVLNTVKSYMYLRVRLLFDPPTSSFLLKAMQDQVNELEWRLAAHRESVIWEDEHPVLDEVVIIDGGTF